MELSDKEKTIAFFERAWPPVDPISLYQMGWREFCDLGKIPSLRAALAVYECRKRSITETEYERSAIRAVQDWVVCPSEEKRKLVGRLASIQEPGYSFARNLANMASRSIAWKTAIAYNLTGNPNCLSDDDFRAYCDAIFSELMAWATDTNDPVAERLHNITHG